MADQVAVITGASSGIGAALVRGLAQNGVRCIAGARRMDHLERLAREVTSSGGICLPMRCDVGVRADAEALVARAVQEWGRLDILVNNAGHGHLGTIEETTDETIMRVFAVNVFALWYTTRPALRQMRLQGSGHVINVASIAGKLGFPLNSAYVAAKHASVGFTHALRMELAGTPIHATVVCPAGVETAWADATEGGSMRELFARSAPIARRLAEEQGKTLPPVEGMKTADEIARMIIGCIAHPVAELYTHRGSAELALLSARKREDAERQQELSALAELTAYREMQQDR